MYLCVTGAIIDYLLCVHLARSAAAARHGMYIGASAPGPPASDRYLHRVRHDARKANFKSIDPISTLYKSRLYIPRVNDCNKHFVELLQARLCAAYTVADTWRRCVSGWIDGGRSEIVLRFRVGFPPYSSLSIFVDKQTVGLNGFALCIGTLLRFHCTLKAAIRIVFYLMQWIRPTTYTT